MKNLRILPKKHPKPCKNVHPLTVSCDFSYGQLEIAKVVRVLRNFLNSVIFVGFISPVNMLLFTTFDMREK